MELRHICGVLAGALSIANGLWILAVRPDPPAGARTATRKFRQVVAIVGVVIGVFLIALSVSSFSPE